MPYFAEKLPHSQCMNCNVFTEGPYKDQNPGRQINIITDEGEILDINDQARENVSHGLCATCRDDMIAKARERAARRNAGNDGEA